ncbi:MAG: hypothetical protein CVU54_14690 [Deltaproteobacteria bacterium HGW-Deltaproteobacteria-12]|jgi:hypothetical protein|nr:MAG: hypothetical protein CVU54_14690 [Deltaproteobacteria bacterium HGW-Deltaproteobacteria-12]
MDSLENKIQKLISSFKGIEPGKILNVIIKHDNGCPALRSHNLSDCTCNPEIITKGENKNGN